MGVNFVASLIPVNSKIVVISEENKYIDNITKLTTVGY